MNSTGLLSMPDELLSLILGYLDRQSDILSARLACRLFNELCIKHYWSSMKVSVIQSFAGQIQSGVSIFNIHKRQPMREDESQAHFQHPQLTSPLTYNYSGHLHLVYEKNLEHFVELLESDEYVQQCHYVENLRLFLHDMPSQQQLVQSRRLLMLIPKYFKGLSTLFVQCTSVLVPELNDIGVSMSDKLKSFEISIYDPLSEFFSSEVALQQAYADPFATRLLINPKLTYLQIRNCTNLSMYLQYDLSFLHTVENLQLTAQMYDYTSEKEIWLRDFLKHCIKLKQASIYYIIANNAEFADWLPKSVEKLDWKMHGVPKHDEKAIDATNLNYFAGTWLSCGSKYFLFSSKLQEMHLNLLGVRDFEIFDYFKTIKSFSLKKLWCYFDDIKTMFEFLCRCPNDLISLDFQMVHPQSFEAMANLLHICF